MHVFIGIDDTDVLGVKPGTGRLARDLGAAIGTQTTRCVAVVRQQLLVDGRIPYTSHNSPACVILETSADDDGDALFETACTYVAERAAPGSDPGVCLIAESDIGAPVVAWGFRAASEVVSKGEARRLADDLGVRCAELGGTGDGIIGALAAVGLTRQGDAGRYLEWNGVLRTLGERILAADLRSHGITPVDLRRNGEPVPPAAVITADGWPRPRRIGGQPVLFVEAAGGGLWRCIDRKNDKQDHA